MDATSSDRVQPSRRRTRLALSLALVVAIIAAVLIVQTERAEACSCMAPDPVTMVDDSEGAFLGTYVGPGDPIKDKNGFGPQRGYEFTVDSWLSGPFDDAKITVKSAENGAACGFEFQPGASVAVFFYEIDAKGLPVSGLCSSMDGTQARAALTPPTVEPGGVATVAVASGRARHHLWLIDDDGNRVGFAERPPNQQFASLASAAPCPNSDLLVEFWRGTPPLLLVRDLTTLEVVRELQVPAGTTQAMCLDADAADVRAITNAAVLSIDQGQGAPAPDVQVGVFLQPVPVPEQRVVLDLDPSGLKRIDLESGEVTRIYEAGQQPLDQNQPDRIESIELSPDQATVAFEVTHYRENRQHSSTAVLIELASGKTITAEFAVEGSRLVWFGPDRLFLNDYSGGSRLLDDTLNEIDPLVAGNGAVTWWNTLSLPDRMLVLNGAEVSRVALDTGDAELLTTLPVGSGNTYLVALSRPVEVTAELPVDSGEPFVLGTPPSDDPDPEQPTTTDTDNTDNTADTTGTTESDDDVPERDSDDDDEEAAGADDGELSTSPLWLIPVLAVVLAAVAVASLVWRRRSLQTGS